MTRRSLIVWRDFLEQAERPIVVHLPRNLGGNSSMLSSAMREIGVSSISIAFEEDRFGFSPDVVICDSDDSLLMKELRRVAWIARVLLRADILHFNSGTTLSMPSDSSVRIPGKSSVAWNLLRSIHARYTSALQLVELFLARHSGKSMFMTFQGDDIRQGDRSLSAFSISIAQHVGSDYYNPRSDRMKRRRLTRFRKFGVRFFVLNPDLNWFLDGEGMFIPYSNVDIKNLPSRDSHDRTESVRIVHAPSHRSAKGTAVITSSIEQLRREGHQFEFELIEGLENDEARRRIWSADLLIDQMYAGWYGGVAVEAMVRGVAVMSYIRNEDLVFIPGEMRNDIPIIGVTEQTLTSEIRKYLILSDAERRIIAARSSRYAELWHSPTSVAKKVIGAYSSAADPRPVAACDSDLP